MDCAGSADLLNASIIAHFIFRINLLKSYNCSAFTVRGQEFSELKIPYDTVMTADFADASHSESEKSTAITVSYGIFSSENSYPCKVTKGLLYCTKISAQKSF